MEYFNLYDENKKLTDKKVLRGDKVEPGFYYIVVVVLIENNQGKFLIQKRSEQKGNIWALTGGHPKLGETSKEGIITEIEEELGMRVASNELFLIKTIRFDNKFADLYYLKKDIDIEDLKLQDEEVSEVRWVTPEYLDDLIKNNLFHRSHMKIYQEFKDVLNRKRNVNDFGTITLETDRLILRRFKVSDYHDMYENWAKDEDVARYVTWYKHQNEEETKELLKLWVKEYEGPCKYDWLVEIKTNHEPIGSIGVVNLSKSSLRAEIGYVYGKKYWHQGYATEALKKVISFLIEEVGLELIVAEYLLSNPNSGKVMAKAGMRKGGILPKWHINKDGFREDLGFYIYNKDEHEIFKNSEELKNENK
ncbi:MAG: GNAT family N-acetyltransferase [Bacilli bacterium]|nr:GNAT family N-acetyltransferase [Bacilli bacterium]